MQNAAVDTDGILVGAAEYSRAKTVAGGGIVLFDRMGKQTAFFDTGEYFPPQISFAPNHSIRVLGWQRTRRDRESRDYFILLNHSREGKELGRFFDDHLSLLNLTL